MPGKFFSGGPDYGKYFRVTFDDPVSMSRLATFEEIEALRGGWLFNEGISSMEDAVHDRIARYRNEAEVIYFGAAADRVLRFKYKRRRAKSQITLNNYLRHTT